MLSCQVTFGFDLLEQLPSETSAGRQIFAANSALRLSGHIGKSWRKNTSACTT